MSGGRAAGADDYNQRLSEQRANAVLDYLVVQGLNGSRITASDRGERAPVASNDTSDGRQKHRRVEIHGVLHEQVTH